MRNSGSVLSTCLWAHVPVVELAPTYVDILSWKRIAGLLLHKSAGKQTFTGGLRRNDSRVTPL